MLETNNKIEGQENSKNKFFALFGETIAKEGIAPIPLALLRYQKELNITPGEMGFIVHLLSYRWRGDRVAHPSLEKMSELTGMSVRVLHKYKTSLLAKKLIGVKNRYHKESGAQLTNEYDFTPLFKKLCEIIESHEKENADRSKEFSEPIIKIPVVVSDKSPGNSPNSENTEQNKSSSDHAFPPMNLSDTSNHRGEYCAPSPVNQSDSNNPGCKICTPGVNQSKPSSDRDAQCAEGGMHHVQRGVCTKCAPGDAQCADEVEKEQVNNEQVEKGQVKYSPYGDATRFSLPGNLREESKRSIVHTPIERSLEVPSASSDYTINATEERSTYGKSSSDGRTSGSLVTESSNDRITPSSTVAVTEESRGEETASKQPGNSKQVGGLGGESPSPAPPTNQQLIAELVKKFWQIPGVKPERGHYPMVGKAYIQYGYDAVQAGIHDLTVEFTWRQARGMPIPEGKDLWAYFIKKCQWNYKRPLTPEEIEERKKPSYDTVTCKRLPDGSVVPKTLDELMQTLMPPGHAYKVIGNTIRVYPVKSSKEAAAAPDAPANKGGNTCA